MPARHKRLVLKRRVSWNDSDPARVMNTPRAFEHATDAIEAVLERCYGVTYTGLIERHGLGQPNVHASCDYLRPLRAGDRFTLAVDIEKLGRASVIWRVEGRDARGRLALRLRVVSSLVRMDRFRAVPIPPRWRKRLAAYVRPEGR